MAPDRLINIKEDREVVRVSECREGEGSNKNSGVKGGRAGKEQRAY